MTAEVAGVMTPWRTVVFGSSDLPIATAPRPLRRPGGSGHTRALVGPGREAGQIWGGRFDARSWHTPSHPPRSFREAPGALAQCAHGRVLAGRVTCEFRGICARHSGRRAAE